VSTSDPNAPERRSWVEVDDQSDFPIQNLPYGVARRDGEAPRAYVAIGDYALDLARLQKTEPTSSAKGP
jgi:fumarylacetoacetase